MGRSGKKVTVWAGERNRRNYNNLPEDSRTNWAVYRLNSERRREQRHKTLRAQKAMLSHVVDTVWFFGLHPFTCDAILDSLCLVTPHAMTEHTALRKY